MTSNNDYYKLIYEKLTGNTLTGVMSDLEVMKLICEYYQCVYTGNCCSNQFLYDFARNSTGQTYTEPQLNSEYLYDIALYYYPQAVTGTDNYYLGIIYENITTTPKLQTDLSIEVPLVIVYSDNFNITGLLVDEEDNPIEDATIGLYVGSTKVNEATTNSQGEVSFTTSPVSMGTHTFQLKYNGSSEYYGTESSIVTRNVNKETSAIALTLPLDNTTFDVGDTMTITGSLSDDDGVLLSGKTITVTYDGNVIDTLTTDTNGAYSTTYTMSIVGSGRSLTLSYGGDDYYTPSSITRTVNVIDPNAYDDIVISSDDSVLSYTDGDTTNLYAQLMNGTSTVSASGVEIEFFNGSTSLGTAQTDSTGKATLSYNSQGVGDMAISGSDGSIFSSETYSIQDWTYYDSQTVDKSRYTTTSGSASISYSSNGVTITGATNTTTLVKNTALTLPSNYSAEVTITQCDGYDRYYGGLCFDNCLLDFSGFKIDIYKFDTTTLLQSISTGLSAGDVLKIEMQNGTMKIYINGTLKSTQTISNTGNYYNRTYKASGRTARSLTTKDLKILEL